MPYTTTALQTVIALAFIIAVPSQSSAGIIVDPATGIVTEATGSSSGDTYYFYEGSYVSTLTTSETTTNINVIDKFYDSQGFAQAFNSYSGTLDTSISYLLATSATSNEVRVNEVRFVVAAWGMFTLNYSNTATTNGTAKGSKTFYFASLTAPTGGSTGSVPEPSTAIAMGLLGLAGFAGNRRRRRQS